MPLVFCDFLFNGHNVSICMRLVVVTVVTALIVDDAVFVRHGCFSMNRVNEERDAQRSG
jgi:hypothetical protein